MCGDQAWGFEMKKFAYAAVAAGLAIACAEDASAAVMVATYTGTVQGTVGINGEFGGIGSSLDGVRFVATYIYDPSRAAFRGSASYSDAAYGGSFFGSGNLGPVISASLRINGITVEYGSQYYSALIASINSELISIRHQVNDYFVVSNIEIQTYLQAYIYSVDSPNSLDSTYDGSPSGADAALSAGAFGYSIRNSVTGHQDFAYGILVPDHLTVSALGGVPEPSTWALTIGGFGVAGVALRRRRMAVAG